MKKKLSVFKGFAVFTILILTFIACDKDYTTLGTNIIGDSNFSDGSVVYQAITYNRKLNPVQTNGLSSDYLGVYHDPIYGMSSANIVTQLTLGGRTSGVNVQLDSVILSIPYYSHIDSNNTTDENGNTNYILDSIYGNVDEAGNSLSTMKLSIYKNNYFLRDYDPDANFETSQKYFSDGSTSEGNTIPVSELESELLYESQPDDMFQFKSDQIILTAANDEGVMEESDRLQPRLRIHLDPDFWKTTIIDKMDDTELSNANNFREYFRGLYIKLEEDAGDGAMGLLNFSSGTVVIYYKSISDIDTDNDGIPDTYDSDYDSDGQIDEGKTDTDNDGVTDDADIDQTGGADDDNDGMDDAVVTYIGGKTVPLNFSGNIVNLYNNNFNPSILSEINSADVVNGDAKLYLKGGEGSMAIVDLFGQEDLNEIRNLFRDETDTEKKLRLINEANLVFYEDQDATLDNTDHDYDRLYVYDLNNNIPLIDYERDVVQSTTPLTSAASHLGLRTEDELGRKKFKIRITDHIKNIIYNDSTNTKLGLTISSNVNNISNAAILGAEEEDLNKVPTGAVLSARGTVLYGNNAVDEDKRVKLEIFYTEPDTE